MDFGINDWCKSKGVVQLANKWWHATEDWWPIIQDYSYILQTTFLGLVHIIKSLTILPGMPIDPLSP